MIDLSFSKISDLNKLASELGKYSDFESFEISEYKYECSQKIIFLSKIECKKSRMIYFLCNFL